jgi:uncharacterized protein YukE
VGFAWDLHDASLYPGDTVFYRAIAKDNYPFDTLHRAITETFWFRIPGFDEIHRQLAQEENSTAGSLKSAQTEQDNIKNELSRLIQSTHGRQSLSWEEKQVIKDLRESLRAQSDTLSKAVSSLKQTMEKLKEQGMSGKDIADKMDKVRAALEDLARQYGDSLLFSPPRTTDRVSMQELKASLEKFEKMLPDLSKRLDSALKYLEMLKHDQKLAAMAMQAQKLGEQQAALGANPEKSERGLARQKDLLKRIDSLVSEISRSSDSTGLLQKNDAPALAHASKRAQSMESALSKGVLPGPSDMNDMSADLFSLADSLRDLQSTAMTAKIKKDQNGLMEMSHNMLNMSEWQEQIASEARQTNSRAHVAQAQEALRQAISKSAEALNSLSMTPPQTLSGLMRQFDKAAQSVGKSLDEIGENSDPSGQMSKSEENLNALAFSLMSAAGSMNGAQGGQGEGESGMMAGMQKLSGKQAMINGATGEVLRQMLGEQGDRPGQSGQGAPHGSSGPAEKAREQAQEAQKEIADELQKLAEKYGKEAGGSFDKRAKDLEEEARRLAKMLDDPKPEIRDHQDRFLSRMLESSVSLHKQDEGKDERTSQSAKTVFSIDGKPLGVGDMVDRDSFYRMRQKAFMSDFPESYRSAIKNYFDSLGTLFLK